VHATLPSVPDYDLLRRIGSGAYGEVWLARSKATGVLRAAKIIWRHTFEDERPFRREFEGIQRFERISRGHSSQLALFHIGGNEEAHYFYYVMELADSTSSEGGTDHYVAHTLRADLEKGRLPATKVLEIGLALSEALSHLHSNGLVHRDVKPSNVIFVNGRPKLADIGLVTDASDSRSIVGTEGYLPPEGAGTPRADIFALGKVLYEAATGMSRREFPKLPEGLRDWPDAAQVFELNEVILKACALNSKSRYPTCDALRSDLALLAKGNSVRQKRARQQWWRRGKIAGIGLIAVAALIALVFARARITAPAQKSWPAALYPDGPPSTNEVANTLCTNALRMVRSNEYTHYFQAYADFRRAIELDPYFAQPSVGMLELRLRESVPNVPPFSPDIADRLEALAPKLAATAAAKSIVSYYDGKFEDAERFAIEATNANSQYELGHTWHGFLLTQWGRFSEGRTELETSLKLAPSKGVVYSCLGDTYYAERDFSNAIAWYRRSLQQDSNSGWVYERLGQTEQALADYTAAAEYFYKADLLNGVNATIAGRDRDEALAVSTNGGATGYWQQQWERTEKNPNWDFYRKAVIQIHLRDTNKALDFLERSYASHERDSLGMGSTLGHHLLFDEYWDGLHGDHRFQHLLDETGLPQVMRRQMQ
jgi:serine/threonine protein kinase